MSSEEVTATTTTLLTDIAGLHFGAPERMVFSGNRADFWNLFFKRWSNYALLTRLDCKHREIQVVILENCLGDDSMRIYQGIQFDTPDSGRTVQDILQALSEYAVRTVNETYERFAFRQRKLEEGEVFDTFYNDLIFALNAMIQCWGTNLWKASAVKVKNKTSWNSRTSPCRRV